MAADHFCLKWNNFHSSIVTAFESLQSSEDLVDVTLMCEGRNVKAHKVILSACSPYFRNLFKETPCQHPIIILKDVLHCDLVAILQFMYQGEVLITQDGLASFLKTAELLQVSGLAGNSATVPEAPIVPTQVAVPVPTLLPIQPSPPSSPRAPQNKLHSEVTLKQTTSSKSSEKENSFSKKEVEAIRFTEPEVEPIQSCSYQQDAVIIKTEADEPEFQEVDDYRMRDENVDDPGPGAEEQSILERSLKAQGMSPHSTKQYQMDPSHPTLNVTPLVPIKNDTGKRKVAKVPPEGKKSPCFEAKKPKIEPVKGGEHGPQFGKCPHCTKIYSNQSALKYHVRLVHSDMLNMFCCHLCPESFEYRETFKAHMWDKHNVRN